MEFKKTITHLQQTKSPNVDLLNIKLNPSESVNHVNNFFAGIGRKLAEDIQLDPLHSPDHTYNMISQSQVSSFVLLETDENEVQIVLMNLKSESAPGWDNIPVKFLKQAKTLLVPIITHLTNLCFNQGIFPTLLKQSIITPVYKAGDRDDVNNYRPTSVLPSISKILEKIINNRLINYLNKFDILSNSQFGFKIGKSTEDAVTSLITEHLDQGRKCLTVFSDLKKAFDTVPVDILVQKLEN